jgi:hypothetical protein
MKNNKKKEENVKIKPKCKSKMQGGKTKNIPR